MKAFVIDLDICNGCYCCQIACKDEHVANDWTPYAKPQPDTGQFWIGMTELVRGQVPKVKVTYLPKLYFNEDLNIAQKCTACSHLRDNDPEWDVPRCVDQCPTDAIRFGEEEDLKEYIDGSELLNPEAGTKSRVHYRNLPKKFVGGTLYDPDEKEVIIGASCVLKDDESGEAFNAETDNFGDFWFRGLKDDRTFTLTMEKDGNSKTIEGISTEIDLSLGDIPMAMRKHKHKPYPGKVAYP